MKNLKTFVILSLSKNLIPKIKMIEIKVENQTIADIIHDRKNTLKFTSMNPIYPKMRIKFYCEGVAGKTYVEGFIHQIFSRQSLVDSKGFEYNCEVAVDLILF